MRPLNAPIFYAIYPFKLAVDPHPCLGLILVLMRLKQRGVNCSTFEILLAMLTRFNTNIYDHKRPKTTASIEVPDQGNEVANEGNDSEGFRC